MVGMGQGRMSISHQIPEEMTGFGLLMRLWLFPFPMSPVRNSLFPQGKCIPDHADFLSLEKQWDRLSLQLADRSRDSSCTFRCMHLLFLLFEHTFFLLLGKVGGDRSAQVLDRHSVLGQVFDSTG